MRIVIGENQNSDGQNKVSIDTDGQLTTLWGTVVAGIKVDKGFFVLTSDEKDLSLHWGEITVFTTDGIDSLDELISSVDSMVDLISGEKEG